jgi:hypothetical protein
MRMQLAAASLLLSTTLAGAAYAAPVMVSVSAQANIYGAGQTTPPGDGELPPSIALKGNEHCLTFTRVKGSLRHLGNSNICPTVEGCITIDHKEPEGTHLNDPDGGGAYPPTSSNIGYKKISGITAPLAGYLVGVFVKEQGPVGPTPPALDFTTGAGTGFTNLAPLIDQTFFIGDGLTGDDTGTLQTFTVPHGAKTLYLGISDACGFNGAPGCYFDNEGTFEVTVKDGGTDCGVTAP